MSVAATRLEVLALDLLDDIVELHEALRLTYSGTDEFWTDERLRMRIIQTCTLADLANVAATTLRTLRDERERSPA
jgi:hypothetical protein